MSTDPEVLWRKARQRLPYAPGSTTSRRAAEEASQWQVTHRRKVHDLLYLYPLGLTDEQIARYTGLKENTVRPRRLELVEAEAVVDTGRTRATESGMEATVWALARHVEGSEGDQIHMGLLEEVEG